MLHNDSAVDLLSEIKNATIKSYSTAHINKLREEIDQIEMKMSEFNEEAKDQITDEISINYAILHLHKERNIRIIRAYHLSRLIKIQDSYFSKEEIRHLINISESDFFEKYSAILNEFIEYYGEIDFHNRHIPMDFFVKVIPLEDCGVVMSGEEFIDLKKNRLYFLKKSDIIHLIGNKVVKIL